MPIRARSLYTRLLNSVDFCVHTVTEINYIIKVILIIFRKFYILIRGESARTSVGGRRLEEEWEEEEDFGDEDIDEEEW